MKNSMNLYLAVVFAELLTGCVTYSKDISVRDSRGTVYVSPRPEESYSLKRNSAKQIGYIEPGPARFIEFSYINGNGQKKKGRCFADRDTEYRICHTPDGEIVILPILPRQLF